MLGGDVGSYPRLGFQRIAGLVLATILSLLILWFSTENIIFVGSCGAAIIAAAGLIQYVRSADTVDDMQELSVPDWSITHAATQMSNAAIAISDRAGRLVCANDHYTIAFPGLKAPPDLRVDDANRALLVAAGRAAWRDGSTDIATIVQEGRIFGVKVARAGMADEYLLWHLAAVEEVAIESRTIEMITGRIGRAMSSSGVMAVAVSADGAVRAANAAFALRATGTDMEPDG